MCVATTCYVFFIISRLHLNESRKFLSSLPDFIRFGRFTGLNDVNFHHFRFFIREKWLFRSSTISMIQSEQIWRVRKLLTIVREIFCLICGWCLLQQLNRLKRLKWEWNCERFPSRRLLKRGIPSGLNWDEAMNLNRTMYHWLSLLLHGWKLSVDWYPSD